MRKAIVEHETQFVSAVVDPKYHPHCDTIITFVNSKLHEMKIDKLIVDVDEVTVWKLSPERYGLCCFTKEGRKKRCVAKLNSSHNGLTTLKMNGNDIVASWKTSE
jgi:hypothetical protein